MPLPSYPDFMWPLLLGLYDQKEPIHVSDVCRVVADRLKLSEEDRAALLPSGKMTVLRNRIGWAHDALKRCRLSNSVKWGTGEVVSHR